MDAGRVPAWNAAFLFYSIARKDVVTRRRQAIAALVRTSATAVCLCVASSALGQLRIVTYNTTGAPRTGMDFILKAIGEEFKSGVVKPIDVLLLQEQSRSTGLPDTQAFVTMLNGIYAGQGITYVRGNLIGGASNAGDDAQTIVYRTNSVQLLSEVAVGTTSSSGQPRQALRYKLKPVGYEDSAAFYIYNSHYKASQGTDGGGTTSNANRRLAEATALRANADALGDGIPIIYTGDHNFYRYDEGEPAVGMLMSAGNGQAFDPLNRTDPNVGSGAWNNNANFKDIHTQSPSTTQRYGGQVTGGLDDRFDIQWVTGELQDNEGMSYISGTYRAFGNNGTTYNTDIDAPANTYPFDFVQFDATHTRSQLLTALASVTDHLPVVADYRIPAKMSVQVASIPSTVNLGASVPISVSVENIAPVTLATFADELDYTLSVTGNLMGGVTDLTPAASGPHFHDIFLDTATPGLKSGLITVMSSSQQASNALFTMPVSFTVLGPTYLAADFNQDGAVNGVDLSAWSGSFGLPTGASKAQGDANLDGAVDGADFVLWQQQLGQLSSSAALAGAVPEPATGALMLALFASMIGGREGRCTRTRSAGASRLNGVRLGT
jgi:hypothetical protein